MAAPRINYIASNFSYAPDVSKVTFFDTLTKFLVVGFGPFTIEKITVSNKIVRVVTTEKSFKSMPGCKLSIDGTGISELDDSHELTAVFSDGFEFEVDTPNGEYTNGLTYSVPSLGWSLVRSTSIQTIYKSEAAATPFYLLITKKYPGGFIDNRFEYFVTTIAYSLDDLDFKAGYYPTDQSEYYQLFPLHIYTQSERPTSYDAPIDYFFYGDSAFIVAGSDSNTTFTYSDIRAGVGGTMATMAVGEITGINNNLPFTFICGGKVGRSDFIGSARAWAWAGRSTSPSLAGVTLTTTYNDAYIGVKSSEKTVNFTLASPVFPKIINTYKSGTSAISKSTFTGSYSGLSFTKMLIASENGSRLGSLPGIYAIEGRPAGINSQPQISKTMAINGKVRRGVLVRSSAVDSGTAAGASSANTEDSVTFLDLTGPIR